MIAFFTGTALGRQLAALGALLIAGLAIAGALISRGARHERAAAQTRTIKAERAAHERMNNVPSFRHASDADHVVELRKLSRRTGN